MTMTALARPRERRTCHARLAAGLLVWSCVSSAHLGR
jgi:hypothetical protein